MQDNSIINQVFSKYNYLTFFPHTKFGIKQVSDHVMIGPTKF
jgi:hypothetical protein